MITIPQKGVYQIDLYALNGRMIEQKDLLLTEGVHNIDFGKKLGSGIIIVKVKGNGLQVTSRLILK